MICLRCNRAALFGKTHTFCASRVTIDGCLASLEYKSIVKKLLYQFKYKPYLTDLQETLAELFYEGIIQQEQFFRVRTADSILVPIPLYPSKRRMRGYNHAELLAIALSKRLALSVVPVLQRVKKTSTQASLTRAARLENMREAFDIDQAFVQKVRGKQVFLVDDIVTTGATMREAAKILKKHGVSVVWGLALAHGA